MKIAVTYDLSLIHILLKTEHLKKYYGKKKIVKAVDDVSLEILSLIHIFV